jgi:hypothetical protein
LRQSLESSLSQENLVQDSRAVRWGALLAATIALGLWLRCANLGDSLWLDELHTDWATGGDFLSVADRAAQGNQPPLYFWLIWLVRQVADSEAALRVPSLIASGLLPLALVLAARILGRESFPPWSALLAAWWWATDDVAIFFGQEARPYAVVQLVAVLQFAAGWNLVCEPTRGARVLFWLLSLVLIYLHYTSGLLLVGELAAYGIWLCGAQAYSGPAYRGKELAIDALLCGLFLTPLIAPLAGIAARRHEWWQFVALPPVLEIGRLYPALVIAPIVLLARRKTLPQLLVARTYLIPLLLALVLTSAGVLPLFFPRYLAALLPLGWLLAGVLPNLVQKASLRRALIALAMVAPVVTNHQVRDALQAGRPVSEHDEDWRAAAAFLRQQIATERAQPLLLVAPRLIEGERLTTDSSERFRDYLLFPVLARYDFGIGRQQVLPLRGPPLEFASEADAERLRGREVWVLARIRADQLEAAQAEFTRELAACGLKAQQEGQHAFGGLQLWRVRRFVVPPSGGNDG